MSLSEFQQSSTKQGKRFEEVVAFVLQAGGWTIIEEHAHVGGCEIDIVAESPVGVQWWIECKGSWQGKTPGSKRGDTVKKAVAVAWYLSTLKERLPYMLITSHLPNAGTLGEKMLLKAKDCGLYDEIRCVDLPIAFVDDEDD